MKQINNGRYKPEKIFGDGTAGVRIADKIAEVEFQIKKQLTY